MVASAPLCVAVTDPIISRFADRLTHGLQDHRWTFAAGAPEADRLAAIAAADVVVCSHLSDREAAAAVRARLVHVTGAGLDRVAIGSLPAAAAVANTFHHARPIAEHVVMSALALNRRLLSADRQLRSGSWRTIATDPAVPLHRTLDTMALGVVGLGSIGAEVVRLGTALGMEARAVRSRPEAPLPDGVRPAWVGGTGELPRLLAESDVVAVTVPLSAATRALIGPAELGLMKPTAVLVNVARGPVVDQAALYAALSGGSIAGAAIDVWWGSPEPGRTPPADFPFQDLDNVILTPHHSGHARSTFERRAEDIAGNISRLAGGLELRNVVRPGPRSAAEQ
ncbi:2-hydroxyacid dehydrogenase [Arthrobacter mobilis]|uniref:Hydroxyacid dehydrogenase n=1 Tax=Arthrobacter mobilis TaxID=2724944 RepID=A0A7X6QMU7_9MICC|nr:2-hydroxyacid dehydrogenase [Arthrobacter mobilis]NKX56810.1 hydroxyacid dehydrogenase [Arthrobacter mobilis]